MRHAIILTAGLVIVLAAPAAAPAQTDAPAQTAPLFTITVTSLDSTSQVVFDYRLLPTTMVQYLPTAEDMEQPDAMHGEGLTTPATIEVRVNSFSAAFYDVNQTGNLHVWLQYYRGGSASEWGQDIINVWGSGSYRGIRGLEAPPESAEDD